MIDSVHVAAAAERARLATSTASSSRSSPAAGSFAGQLARFTSTAPAEVKAVARPDNEHTTKVAGHPYSRIENGRDKGMFLNQLDGSPREGAVFKRVERDDRVFHVYGTGRDRVIVEVKARAKDDATTPTGGATPAT